MKNIFTEKALLTARRYYEANQDHETVICFENMDGHKPETMVYDDYNFMDLDSLQVDLWYVEEENFLAITYILGTLINGYTVSFRVDVYADSVMVLPVEWVKVV